MKNRGFAPVARRVAVTLFLAALFTSLVTLCWGRLSGRTLDVTTLLGPSAQPAAVMAQSSRSAVAPGLQNLTYAPYSSERSPAWSPTGERIAFVSDGIDTNGDGRLDQRSADGLYSIYSMNADRTGLTRYQVAGASALTLAWDKSGNAIYAVVVAGSAYQIVAVPLYGGSPHTLYTSPRQINTLAASPAGSTLYFDMLASTGFWQVYALSTQGGEPGPVTDAGSNARYPSVAVTASSPNGELLFASDRSGANVWRIYRCSLGGGTPVPLTSPLGGADTYPRATADGHLLFTSTRPVSAGDPQRDENVWVMEYGTEGTGSPVIEAAPRFYAYPGNQPLDSSRQTQAAPQVLRAKADQVLFVSDQDGNDEIYLGSLLDTTAPYIMAAPTATPQVVNAGGKIKVQVQVTDDASAVRAVWLQIKDPDPAALDEQGANHVIARPSLDWQLASNGDQTQKDIPSSIPVEFGTFDPTLNVYPDLSLVESDPGYYARAGAARLFPGEGAGYPEVPRYWLRMYDDGTHGDLAAGDGTYTVDWQTPSGNSSDWYFDIITEDMAHVQADSYGYWHGNRRRFDNVGGASTLPFAGGRQLLFVDDHVDGQRLLSTGQPPAALPYDAPTFPNSLYYFSDGAGDAARRSPFLPGGEMGATDVWRVLSRGPVPDSVLNRYLPTQMMEVSVTDRRTPVTVKHGDKAVVWVAPNPSYRLLGAGSLVDPAVQASLTTFVASGGRLFVIGADVAQSLTQEGTRSSNFLTNILGATFVSAGETLSTMQGQFNTSQMPTPASDWFGATLPTPRTKATYLLPRNDNPSQFINLNTNGLGDQSTWDIIAPTASAKAAFVLQDLGPMGNATQNNGTVAVTREHTTAKTRSIFWSFGYEHLSSQYRNRPLLDSLEWLLDGEISGRVARDNGPVPDALVLVSTVTAGALPTDPVVTKRIGAARTDSDGFYHLYNLRSGNTYRLEVVANGYGGAKQSDNVIVHGGQVTNDASTSFFLVRDPGTAIVWGYVGKDNVPVSGVTVTATPLGGNLTATTTTDAQGHYELSNLATGQYSITATDSASGATVTVTPSPLTAGETRRVDLSLSGNAASQGWLKGIVNGDGLPIPGARVTVSCNGAPVTTASTDLNGAFAIANLSAGTYTVEVAAPGFYGDSETIVYQPQTGAMLAFNLRPIDGVGTGHLYGRVYDAGTSRPLGGARVDILVGDTIYATKATSSTFQTSGYTYNFDFELPAGSYRLRISADGRRTQEQAFSLAPGQTLANLEFRAEPLLVLSPGIVMFSLPGDYTGQDFATVLGLNPGYLADNRLVGYRSGVGYQAYTGPSTLPIQPGAAYWLRLDQPVTLAREGSAVDASKPFSRPLAAGWNMVGNPFPFAVDLYDCGVVANGGSVPYTWTGAQQMGLIGGAVYSWVGSQYQPGTTMQPYYGYWIYASQPCTLLIANRTALTQRATSKASRSAASQSEWRVRLEVRAGESRDTENYFGVSLDGDDGFNNVADLRKAPAPMGDYVALVFPHRGWGTNSGDFAADIQSPAAGEKKWSFEVNTNQPDTDVVLSWPDLQAQLPAGYQAVLYDVQAQQSCYLNTVSQYSFRSSAGAGSRSFEITVSPRRGALLVSGIRGAAGIGRGHSMISYTLSESAQVVITIRSQTGRVVRTLQGTGMEPAGEGSMLWDGRDAQGRTLPRGMYLCEVRAIDGQGRQARAAGLMTVVAGR